MAPVSRIPTHTRRRSGAWTIVIPVLLAAGMAGAIAIFAIAGRPDDNGLSADPTATVQIAVATETREPEATVTTAPTDVPTVAATATLEPSTATPEPATPTVTVAPTATATLTATVAPTATATLTPTVSPTATVTVAPTATQQGIAFNTPFPAGELSPSITQGPSTVFGAAEFEGAWRADDGEGFGRPAAFLFGPGTGHDVSTVLFTVDEAPENYIIILLTGMDDDASGQVDMRLSLNGNLVWEGPSPFAEVAWTEVGWQVGELTWLEAGVNLLTIELISDADDHEIGETPWLGFTISAVLYG
jgi:hypothetical protein